MLTKKEYELIAGVIKCLPSRPTKRDIVRQFADRLEVDNTNFDRDKFIQACNVDMGYNPVGEAIEFLSGSREAETEP